MRVLIVTNMYPSRERPEFGVFVRDQLEALCRIEGVEAELFAFEGGGMRAYKKQIRKLRKHLKAHDYDIVHAHYGLTGWVARRAKAKPLVVTYHGTDLRHEKVRKWSRRLAKRADQAAVVSAELGNELSGIKKLKRPIAVLPTGVNLDRAKPLDRIACRKQLGIDPEGSFVLFPADPERPEKRYDRATQLLEPYRDVELLALRHVSPSEVAVWINACDAVIVPSDYEGFGLATVEALACNVPVVATPTGVAADALAGVQGSYCLPFELATWRQALNKILEDPDPRIVGAARANHFSSDAMAERLVAVYNDIVPAGPDA